MLGVVPITEPVYFPRGAADPAGRIGYLAVESGVLAVDLSAGRELWRSDQAQRPLLVAGERLAAARLGDDPRVVLLDGHGAAGTHLRSRPAPRDAGGQAQGSARGRPADARVGGPRPLCRRGAAPARDPRAGGRRRRRRGGDRPRVGRRRAAPAAPAGGRRPPAARRRRPRRPVAGGRDGRRAGLGRAGAVGCAPSTRPSSSPGATRSAPSRRPTAGTCSSARATTGSPSPRRRAAARRRSPTSLAPASPRSSGGVCTTWSIAAARARSRRASSTRTRWRGSWWSASAGPPARRA